MLKALKKVRSWLYGVKFILETDANVLVAQLNQSASDLPGALVTRWLAWIRLFDFEVRHVPGRKHTAADGLSRRPRTKSDDIDKAHEEDIDEFIQQELNAVQVAPIVAEQVEEVERAAGEGPAGALEGGYSAESNLIAEYLTTLRRPEQVAPREFRRFKARALQYVVQGRHLFRRARKRVPQTRVLDDPAEREEVLKSLHDQAGHKGRESTYHKVAERYFWDSCYQDVKRYCASCPECQLRRANRLEEPLYPTWTSCLWEKVGLDIVHMPPSRGKSYLVVARDDLSGWPEARALSAATSEAVARFLWEDVICRHGVFGRLVIDGGPENKGVVEALTRKYGIQRVVVSAYHPPANGMVERGHGPFSDSLAKVTAGGLRSWVDNLHAVLLAERTTVKATTGRTPFFLNYGSEAALPVELDIPTWRTLDWPSVRTRSDLLALRARQLLRRDEDLQEATLRLRRSRLQGREAFDEARQIRQVEVKEGDLVLLHDALQEVDMSKKRKLGYRWLGPYRVSRAIPDKGTYFLEEFDGTPLHGTFAGNRLKVFVQREGVMVERGTDQDEGAFSPPGGGNEEREAAPSSHGPARELGGDEVQRSRVQVELPARSREERDELAKGALDFTGMDFSDSD